VLARKMGLAATRGLLLLGTRAWTDDEADKEPYRRSICRTCSLLGQALRLLSMLFGTSPLLLSLSAQGCSAPPSLSMSTHRSSYKG
jgi:hypothetical protein